MEEETDSILGSKELWDGATEQALVSKSRFPMLFSPDPGLLSELKKRWIIAALTLQFQHISSTSIFVLPTSSAPPRHPHLHLPSPTSLALTPWPLIPRERCNTHVRDAASAITRVPWHLATLQPHVPHPLSQHSTHRPRTVARRISGANVSLPSRVRKSLAYLPSFLTCLLVPRILVYSQDDPTSFFHPGECSSSSSSGLADVGAGLHVAGRPAL
jgi:hypothetical protein